MGNLSTDIDNLKKKYREIFLKTNEDFSNRTAKMDPGEFNAYLTNEIFHEICKSETKIIETKEKYSCQGCALCCKLAASEFSPEELRQKAQNNDNFAGQFLSIFVPYENEEDARKVYPEYFELLKEKAEGEKVYFYHCPKVTSDNKCPDYENRPQICSDFPDNPISLLPRTCGYKHWKEEVEEIALRTHALVDIVDFYKDKIQSQNDDQY